MEVLKGMENIKVIVCGLENERYGIDIQHVISIERLETITNVPQMAEFIKGVMSFRGEIIPVIDLKERLHIIDTTNSDKSNQDKSRILVVRINDLHIGILVDSATDVIDVNASVIEPAPKLITGVGETYINGVANLESGLLILLDLQHVLNLEEINQVQEIIKE